MKLCRGAPTACAYRLRRSVYPGWRTVLMDADRRAVNGADGGALLLQLCLIAQDAEDFCPETSVRPRCQAPVDCLPPTKPLWKVAPRGAGSQHPHDAIEEAPIVQRWPTTPGQALARRMLEVVPRHIAQISRKCRVHSLV